MKGTIEDFFDSKGTGQIVGEDGLRYDFTKTDFSGSFKAEPGAKVEFEPSGGHATSVRLIDSQSAITEDSAQFPSEENQGNSLPGSGTWLAVMIPMIILDGVLWFYSAKFAEDFEYSWIVYFGINLVVVAYIFNRTMFAWEQVGRFGGRSLTAVDVIARAVIPVYQIYGTLSLHMRITDELNQIHDRVGSGAPKIAPWFAVITGILNLGVLFHMLSVNDEIIRFSFASGEIFGPLMLVQLVTQTAFGHMVLQRAIYLERMQPLVATSSRSL